MRRRDRLVPLAVTLLFPTLPQAALGVCQADSPARPVPQFDNQLAPGVSLWPLEAQTGAIKLKPAKLAPGITRPQVPALPANRDSTQYQTLSAPGQFSGHELFQDVAVPGSRQQSAGQSDWLIAVYNAGLEIWDLRTDPEMPTLAHQRDGWPMPFGPGTWAEFPHFSEEDTYLFAVDAVKEGNFIYIGISALTGVGFSIWTFNTVANTLVQSYQDLNVWSYGVSMAKDTNGRIYAYVTDLGGASGNPGGLRVYDVTSAGAGGLCLDPPGSTPCGVFMGKVGDVPKTQFVSAFVAGGETHVAVSDGYQLNGPHRLEIWQVTHPDQPGASTLRFDGLGSMVSSPQLFSYDGKHYLAVVENLGASPSSRDEVMRVYDIGHCVSGASCATLGSPKASENIAALPARFNYLDLSFSNGAPFLHYGLEGSGASGSSFERLWNLGQLPQAAAPNTLPELTDGGGTYVDPCNNKVVNYFGDYFTGNEWGLRNFEPRHAVFTGPYLYRAGTGVLDIHVRGTSVPPSDPVILVDLEHGGSIGADTFWLDEQVDLETTVQNCTPGALAWCWLAEVGNPSVAAFPVPAALSGCDASFGPDHTMTFQCTAAGRCADTAVAVAAWNQSASCASTAADPDDVVFQLKDPEVDATGIDTGGSEHPVCQTLPLDATAAGRGAATWAWLADGAPIEGCGGTVPAGADLSAVSFRCDWDSSGQSFDLLFADGFETGGCTRWSSGCPAPSFQSGEVRVAGWGSRGEAARGVASVDRAGGSVEVEIELRTLGGALLDALTQAVTFLPVGDPAFNGLPPLPVVTGSAALLRAPATDTTRWTWEIEDPDAGVAPCSFAAGKSCVTIETATDSVEYLWQRAGTFTFRVVLSNCVSVLTAAHTGSVTVLAAALPEIVRFKVSPASIKTVSNPNRPCVKDVLGNCGAPGTLYCARNETILFDLGVLEAGSFNFSFDWERASAGETPSFVGQAPVSVSGTDYVFSRAFHAAAPSPNFPIAAVQLGNQLPLGDNLQFGSCP